MYVMPRVTDSPRAKHIMDWVEAFMEAWLDGREVYSIKTHNRLFLS